VAVGELFPRQKTSKNQRASLFPTPVFQPRPPAVTTLGLGSPLEEFARRTQAQPGILDLINSGGLAGVPGILSPVEERARLRLASGGLLGSEGESLGMAPSSPTADAARLLSGAVRGNPFINEMGQARLMSGRAPLLSEIDPTFFGTTSPTVQRALLGLFQSMGMRPEDVQFFFESTRIPGL